jgi:phosphate transport system substrate-binding protein
MKKLLISILEAAIFLILGLSFNSCGNKTANSGKTTDSTQISGEISLSGAFALYPLAVKWADEFKKLHPDVKIDISAGGAGKGITDALAEVVDLGMVSRELKPEETAKGAIGFAVAKDAVVPTVNVKNPALKDLLAHGLTRDAAIGLWITQEVKTWGQVAGTADQTSVNVYTRSDACGAAETWAKWLGKKQEDLNGTGVFGDPGVASAVQKDVNGIGLNNIGYAYDEKTRKPNPGIIVLPLDVNGNGKIDADENFYDTKDKLIKAIAAGKYPSPPARDLYLVSKGKPTKPAVVAFINYVLTKGQKLNVPQGYIGLDKAKLKKGLDQLK